MQKDMTYAAKFAMLNEWLPMIIEAIKKDLRNEHLKKDWAFFRNYFSGKNLNKLSTEELTQAYGHALANHEKAEELAEFLSNRWLLKHSDLYSYFERELSKINPNFNELETLDKNTSSTLMEGAIHHFGAPSTYLFCVLNSVVFPEEIYQVLGQKAQKGKQQEKEEESLRIEKQSIENMQKSYDQQIARLKDKYEKKLAGLEKKYIQDTEALKKQIAALQRKLHV